MTKIIIVDKNNKQIGAKERDLLNHPKDIYRVSSLWLTNSKKQILLAQRSFKKKNQPGVWGPAVAGTVEENETFLSNMVKEIKEEIGLTGLELTKSALIFNQNGDRRFFAQFFTTKIDLDVKNFKIRKEEVEQVKWFDKQEIEKQLKNNPENFVDNFELFYKILVKED